MGTSGPQDESSVELVRRARDGDRRALDHLFERYLPVLRRWAAGRLPRWARDLVDTDDMIQETLMGTFRNVGAFEPRHDGALGAYLRQALNNRIRDEVRTSLAHWSATERRQLAALLERMVTDFRTGGLPAGLDNERTAS